MNDIQVVSYRVLIKFWRRQLECKSRRLGNQVPFLLSSISWKGRRFFRQPPSVDENLGYMVHPKGQECY